MITFRPGIERRCANSKLEGLSSGKNSSGLRHGVLKLRVGGFGFQRLRFAQGRRVPILFITAYKNQEVKARQVDAGGFLNETIS
jgi:hypothetical protein